MAKDNENQQKSAATPVAAANTVGREVLPSGSAPAPATPTTGDPSEPERTNGTLTRRGMEQVIRNGQSVTFGGRVYSRVEDLPSEEQVKAFIEKSSAFHAEHAKDKKP